MNRDQDKPELSRTDVGTPYHPSPPDDSREWDVTQGASWEESGTDTPRVGASEEERREEQRRHLRLTGGGTLDDELQEPEPEELRQSGPGRQEE